MLSRTLAFGRYEFNFRDNNASKLVFKVVMLLEFVFENDKAKEEMKKIDLISLKAISCSRER